MPLRAPTTPLTDGVVRLRPLTWEDEAALAALTADPDVLRFTLLPDPVPPGFPHDWLARYVTGWQEGTRAGFAVELVEDGAFAGFASLLELDEEGRQGELGYIVAPAHRGRGLGGRALRLLADWCLADQGLARVELLIETGNPGSLGVAARAGFTHEGTRRSVHVKNGRRADMTTWGRLATDPA